MLRFNNSAFMTKKLSKETIKKSKLKNNFNKNINHENWCKYKTQRNYCVNLLRKSKKQYFSNINVSDVTDNKSFWKSVKLYFSNKGSNSNKIALVENDITNDRVISKTMNKFFINTSKKLNLKPFKSSSDTDVNQIASVFKNHVSIRKIQECFPNIEANVFNFRQVSLNEVKSEILNLNIKKSSTKGFIPNNNIKTMCRYLPSVFNKEILFDRMYQKLLLHHMFEVRWNVCLVNYFSLMHR